MTEQPWCPCKNLAGDCDGDHRPLWLIVYTRADDAEAYGEIVPALTAAHAAWEMATWWREGMTPTLVSVTQATAGATPGPCRPPFEPTGKCPACGGGIIEYGNDVYGYHAETCPALAAGEQVTLIISGEIHQLGTVHMSDAERRGEWLPPFLRATAHAIETRRTDR